MELEFLTFFISLIVYFLFLLVSVLLRIGNNSSPMGSFNKLHLKFSLVYLLSSTSFLFYFDYGLIETLTKVILGLICFFLLHYSIFLNFFALSQRSISSAILKLLFEKYAKNYAELNSLYAGGQGFVYIQNSRLADLERVGWIRNEAGYIFISPSGKLTIKLVNFILLLFGLKQIGGIR